MTETETETRLSMVTTEFNVFYVTETEEDLERMKKEWEGKVDVTVTTVPTSSIPEIEEMYLTFLED